MAVDISELTSQINGNVLTPGNGGYDESLHRWAENAERKAAVVVLVVSSADVAVAVIPHFDLNTDSASSHLPRKMDSKSPLAGDDIPQPAHLLPSRV